MGVERRVERLEAESRDGELVLVYEDGERWLDGKPSDGGKPVDKAALRASDAVVLVVRYENPPPS
jgi:hypothetical protein